MATEIRSLHSDDRERAGSNESSRRKTELGGFWNYIKRMGTSTDAGEEVISDAAPFDNLALRPVSDELKLVWEGMAGSLQNPFAEVLHRWGTDKPDLEAFVWLNSIGDVELVIPWSTLELQARKLAVYLTTKAGLTIGSRVILCYLPGVDFVIAFLGCLISGIVPVPVYPPNPAKSKKDVARFIDIKKRAGVRVILTNTFYRRVSRLLFGLSRASGDCPSGGDSSEWVATNERVESVSDYDGRAWCPPRVTPNTVAFLQFTSGSTSEPKGVVVTHGSLLHNCHLCGRAFGLSTKLEAPGTDKCLDSCGLTEYMDFMEERNQISLDMRGHQVRIFSWLPVYHDMGLIGCLVSPLMGGACVYHMSPIDFIKSPQLWLSSISRYDCICSAGPNFAFELAVRKTPPEMIDNMDLSRVCGLLCGAEPIRPSTIAKCLKTFSRAGLRADAIIPAYGLAENTLIVSSRISSSALPKVLTLDAERFRAEGVIVPVGRCAENGLQILTKDYEDDPELDLSKSQVVSDSNDLFASFVGNGPPCVGTEVLIVNPNSRMQQPPNQSGEIWICSSSSARGYFNMPKTTAEDFYATAILLDGTVTAAQYTRTGDTGFFYEGELFIAGRRKDLIVVRGLNFFPQDIEAIVDNFPEIRSGCVAAFSTGGALSLGMDFSPSESFGDELLCIAAELRDKVINSSGSRTWMSPFWAVVGGDQSKKHNLSLDLDSLCDRIAKKVTSNVGVGVYKLFLLSPRTVSKTTSGKIRRSLMKDKLLSDPMLTDIAVNVVHQKTFDVGERDAEARMAFINSIVPVEELPTSHSERLEVVAFEMFSIIMEVVDSPLLPMPEIGGGEWRWDAEKSKQVKQLLTTPIFELGLDSPTAVEFSECIRKRLDLSVDIISPVILFRYPTMELLIRYLTQLTSPEEARTPPSEKTESTMSTDRSPLRQKIEDIEGASLESSSDVVSILTKVATAIAACQADRLGCQATVDNGCLSLPPVKHRRFRSRSGSASTKFTPEEDIEQLTQLLPTVGPFTLPTHYREVFLTGATGFLGRLQLVALLRVSRTVRVYCLVRARDKKTGFDRVVGACREAGIWDDQWASRVSIVCGDVSKAQFGLAGPAYKVLCQSAQLVIHTAADINLFKAYSRIRGTNVVPILHLARFCAAERVKPLFFCSTLGFFPPYFAQFQGEFAECQTLREEDLPTAVELERIFPRASMGYPWSKWVCEQVLATMSDIGLPVVIVRYPLTCICYETGFTQESNIMVPMTLAALQEGILPSNFVMTSMTPTDIAARHVVEIAVNGRAALDSLAKRPIVLHVMDTTRVDGVVVGSWIKALGLPLELKDGVQFINAVQRRGDSSPLFSQLPLLTSQLGHYWFSASRLPVSSTSHLPISADKFNSYTTSPQWPPSRDVFKSFFLHCLRLRLSHPQNFPMSVVGCARPVFANEYPSSATELTRRNVAQVMSQLSSNNGTETFSFAGQTMLGVWRKYSQEVAEELDTSTSDDPGLMTRVIVIVSLDRIVAGALQNLLVSASNCNTITLAKGLPSTADSSAAQDYLDILSALGLLGTGATSASMMADKDFNLATSPTEDSLLLEMLPGGGLSRSFCSAFGFIRANGEKQLYKYHRRYLISRGILTDGCALVLNSPFHALHLDELFQNYPMATVVCLHRDVNDLIGKWMEDAEITRRVMFDNPNLRDSRSRALQLIHDISHELTEFRISNPALAQHFVDLPVSAIFESPLRALRQIFATAAWDLNCCGVSSGGDIARLVGDFVARNFRGIQKCLEPPRRYPQPHDDDMEWEVLQKTSARASLALGRVPSPSSSLFSRSWLVLPLRFLSVCVPCGLWWLSAPSAIHR